MASPAKWPKCTYDTLALSRRNEFLQEVIGFGPRIRQHSWHIIYHLKKIEVWATWIWLVGPINWKWIFATCLSFWGNRSQIILNIIMCFFNNYVMENMCLNGWHMISLSLFSLLFYPGFKGIRPVLSTFFPNFWKFWYHKYLILFS